jgi:hypothetical protein
LGDEYQLVEFADLEEVQVWHRVIKASLVG